MVFIVFNLGILGDYNQYINIPTSYRAYIRNSHFPGAHVGIGGPILAELPWWLGSLRTTPAFLAIQDEASRANNVSFIDDVWEPKNERFSEAEFW